MAINKKRSITPPVSTLADQKFNDLFQDARHEDHVMDDFGSDVSKRSEPKKMRKINPFGMRVVVQLRKEANQTDGGLYLPEGAKQNMQESLLVEVLEVASAHDSDTDEEHNVSGVPLGALVLIPKEAGVKVPWDDTLRIVDTKEILAIVNEVSIT